jgi:DHA1 family multidrug resistance protein-like MFS transporter
VTERARTWLAQWGPMLPLLIAEATIWVGFGALLPILPIYFTEHGLSLPMLGIVVAAWSVARLVGEPVFGRIADNAPRRTMMVIGLFGAAVFAVAPLFVAGPVAFVATRLLAGLSASMYDPAARGYLVDANPPERQGETFGLYGAAQMGGLILGPAIGGLAAAATGNPTIPFWVAGICVFLSGILVWARVRDVPRTDRDAALAAADAGAAAAGEQPVATSRPSRLLNRVLIAAIVINVGSFFASGAYEVVWSLYLGSLGAGLELIGLSFVTFALPILILSPVMGRFIDHEGGFLALVLGIAVVAVCGGLYAAIPNMWWVIGLGLVEGAAFAVVSPALFLLVARSSPIGRSSTAQGLFGAAGTIGTIVASLSAGFMADIDLRLPFVATAVGAGSMLIVGLLIGRRRLYDAMQPSHLAPADAVAGTSAGPQPAFDGSGDRR